MKVTETNLFFINALVEGVFGLVTFFNPQFMFYGAERNPTLLTAGRMAGALMFTLGVISYEGAKSTFTPFPFLTSSYPLLSPHFLLLSHLLYILIYYFSKWSREKRNWKGDVTLSHYDSDSWFCM